MSDANSYWRWHDAVGLARPGRPAKPPAPIYCPDSPAPSPVALPAAVPAVTNAEAYANALKHYERLLQLVNEQLDREWLAYISGRCDLRYRGKTKSRLVYLEGMIARIKYVHLPEQAAEAPVSPSA